MSNALARSLSMQMSARECLRDAVKAVTSPDAKWSGSDVEDIDLLPAARDEK